MNGKPTIERLDKSTLQGRMFTDHPRSLGMSWIGHGVGAARIGIELVGAGLACVVHAIIPGLFTQTAGKTVTRIYDQMAERKRNASNSEAWSDYEI